MLHGSNHNISPVIDLYCNCLSYPGLTEGELRLSNGLIPQEGTVEMCVGGTWMGFCDWDNTDAYVLCRQMGYPATGI